MILTLDNDTYEQLGLNGVRRQQQGGGGQWEIRHLIQPQKWSRGQKMYERIIWCLQSDRIHPIQLLLSYYQHHHQPDTAASSSSLYPTPVSCQITFPSSIKVIDIIHLKTQQSIINNISIPSIIPLFPSSSSSSLSSSSSSSSSVQQKHRQQQSDDDDDAILQDMFDWCGLVANRLNELLLMVGEGRQLSPSDDPIMTTPLCPNLLFLLLLLLLHFIFNARDTMGCLLLHMLSMYCIMHVL